MKRPSKVILVIGGHDPTGGAGITSDIETINSFNCHAVSLVSCLTSQNTKEFKMIESVSPQFFSNAAKTLLSDIKVDAVKIGAVGNIKIVEQIGKILSRLGNAKVIVDPVIKSSSGGILIEKDTIEAVKSTIFPQSFLITPNLEEVKVLSGKENLSEAMQELFLSSIKYILAKDTEKNKKHIINKLYSKKGFINSWKNPKKKGYFHGTGCNLSSSIACLIADSRDIEVAIEQAQKRVLEFINSSIEIGMGQRILKIKKNEK